MQVVRATSAPAGRLIVTRVSEFGGRHGPIKHLPPSVSRLRSDRQPSRGECIAPGVRSDFHAVASGTAAGDPSGSSERTDERQCSGDGCADPGFVRFDLQLDAAIDYRASPKQYGRNDRVQWDPQHVGPVLHAER